MNQFSQAQDMIHDLLWEHLPAPVKLQARRCLLDTVGSAIGGRKTRLSSIIYEFAASAFGGKGAHLWLDGREVSPAGAALAHGMTIDSLDIHDSCRPVKGHAGVALVPAVLATLSSYEHDPTSGKELLASLVIGYEIAIRAGKSLHASACDYHTSGAWNALGCAAIAARRLKLNAEQTRHALGIAEYHGPRSQMMRCIDHPTMLKDGSGWGAMAGVSAGLMAAAGFTGAPALTVEDEEVQVFWEDMGEHWCIMEQYFKPYAVCYWAQPAISGALGLQREHDIQPEEIERIRVYAFHEATRLATYRPETTEEAQYSLPFPLAAAIVHKKLGYEELSKHALHDPFILELAGRVELLEADEFNARFPADRLSRVVIETKKGDSYDSGEVRALWDLTAQASDEELKSKFSQLANGILDDQKTAALKNVLWNCEDQQDASRILDLLVPGDDRAREAA